MNRGARHQTVFHSAGDARRFLDLVGSWIERTGIEVHTFCLMTNHFHLLVRSPAANLSEFMQQVSASYTKQLNARCGYDGALFRGRFHSKLVDTDAYLTTVSSYIHRNPVAIRPPVQLDRYRWSGYGMLVGTIEAVPWLTTDVLLERHGGPAGIREHVDGPSEPFDAGHAFDVVSAATAELIGDDTAPANRLDRMVALLVADHLPAESAALLVDLLGYPTKNALSSARCRARRRLIDEPTLARVIDRITDTIARQL